MYKIFASAALVLAAMLGLAFVAHAQEAKPVKVVYHVNTDVETIAPILKNIRNHLNADPMAKIVVVTHGMGIKFLLQGAKDSMGQEFSGTVSDLASKGVEFRVCNNTLTANKVSPDRLLKETRIVPSGVAEVARLQAQEGYVYLKL